MTVAHEPPTLVFAKRTVQLSALAVAFGTLAGFSCPPWVASCIVAAGIVLSIRWRWGIPVVLLCSIGLIRGFVAVPDALPQERMLRGVVLDEPSVTVYTLPVRLDFGRRISVSSGSVGFVHFGDEIVFSCASWTWRSRFDVPRCKASNASVVAHDRAGWYRNALHALQTWLQGSIRRAMPEPESSFLAGLLIGSREEIPKELIRDFRISGTSHIVAVSGFNVTIVVTLIASVIGLLPMPRTIRTCLLIAAIVGFVGLTGASASVVRAGIMGAIVAVGKSTGRISDASHALFLTAVSMVVADPTVITDIGFQLSVGSTFGLIRFGNAFSGWLRFLPDVADIRSSLASTLSAITMTTPIIVLYFGQFSVIAPVTNLLALPLIPVAMLAGFCVSIVVGIVPATAVAVSWIAWVPLKLIIAIVSISARIPFASVALDARTAVCAAAVAAAGVAFLHIRVQKTVCG